MFRRCAVLAVLGCAVVAASAQHQYQQEPEVPPHLLRQYLAQQQQAQAQAQQHAQVLQRPHVLAGPARLPYAVQSEDQYQQPQPQYRPTPQPQYRPAPQPQPQPQPQYRPAPQPQPQPQYRPAPQPQPQPQYRPAPQTQYRPQQEERDPQEDYDPHPSYQFGFDVSDDQYTNYQNRKEQRDGDVIKGSYSVVDSDGFIRTVNYVADPKEGFKAEVSRQPTDIVVKIPTPKPQTLQHQPISHPQPTHSQHQQRPQAPPQYYRYEQQ